MNMDNNRKACNICNKRVLNHSYHLQCDICQCFVHLKCLPYVTREDDLYVKRTGNKWFCTCCTSILLPFNHFDDDHAFNSAIAENFVNKCSVTLDNLN